MKVLAVDGPIAGKVNDIEQPDFKYPTSGTDSVTYYAHRFRVLGHEIWIASIHLDAGDINDDFVFNAILSDKAREVLIANER
jgi:hypothetical protein